MKSLSKQLDLFDNGEAPDLYLGCLICADPKKDEWFAQLVSRQDGTILGYKVHCTAMEIGKEAVLRRVCDHANIHWTGIESVPPKARYVIKGKEIRYTAEAEMHLGVGVSPSGLTASMKDCENALERLTHHLRVTREFGEALDGLTETLRG